LHGSPAGILLHELQAAKGGLNGIIAHLTRSGRAVRFDLLRFLLGLLVLNGLRLRTSTGRWRPRCVRIRRIPDAERMARNQEMVSHMRPERMLLRLRREADIQAGQLLVRMSCG